MPELACQAGKKKAAFVMLLQPGTWTLPKQVLAKDDTAATFDDERSSGRWRCHRMLTFLGTSARA